MDKRNRLSMQLLSSLLKPEWWRFEWRYWRNQTPWNTGMTPPEVLDFIGRTPPGRALDIGCGTGTNAVTLAQHDWEVTGIDFSPKAIRAARKKAAARRLAIDFILTMRLNSVFCTALSAIALIELKLEKMAAEHQPGIGLPKNRRNRYKRFHH